jgi:uncharacterized CHY-type Zn-finger protein
MRVYLSRTEDEQDFCGRCHRTLPDFCGRCRRTPPVDDYEEYECSPWCDLLANLPDSRYRERIGGREGMT